MAVQIYKISLQVLKKYFTSERSEWVKYFSTWEEKISKTASSIKARLFLDIKSNVALY